MKTFETGGEKVPGEKQNYREKESDDEQARKESTQIPINCQFPKSSVIVVMFHQKVLPDFLEVEVKVEPVKECKAMFESFPV